MDLYDTNAGQLDKFIFDHLQPNQKFLADVRWAINFICTFLRENCFKDAPPPRPRVLKVVKGGSSGKGTALKGGSDADLVLFLSIFKQYKDQKQNRKGVILEIQKRLEEIKNKQQKNIDVIFEPTKWPEPRVLSFRLCSYDREDFIEFDVLPAFDALGQRTGTKPSPEVYIDLIDSSNQSGEFSTCFTELQKDFIIDRPTKLKSLIRLLKHWYKEYVNNQYRQLPPKYVLELLAVYAWEKGSGKTDFNMAEGFRTVLWLLQQYEHLCIFWTKYYDFRNETLKQYLIGQLRKPRPVILDPADPTGLLGQGSRWDLLAQEAEYCLSQKCCTNVSSVLHWDVPLQVSWEEEASYCTFQAGYGRYIPDSYPVTPERPVQWGEEMIYPSQQYGISRPLPATYEMPERQLTSESRPSSLCSVWLDFPPSAPEEQEELRLLHRRRKLGFSDFHLRRRSRGSSCSSSTDGGKSDQTLRNEEGRDSEVVEKEQQSRCTIL